VRLNYQECGYFEIVDSNDAIKSYWISELAKAHTAVPNTVKINTKAIHQNNLCLF
jgi:hypothetical protein